MVNIGGGGREGGREEGSRRFLSPFTFFEVIDVFGWISERTRVTSTRTHKQSRRHTKKMHRHTKNQNIIDMFGRWKGLCAPSTIPSRSALRPWNQGWCLNSGINGLGASVTLSLNLHSSPLSRVFVLFFYWLRDGGVAMCQSHNQC